MDSARMDSITFLLNGLPSEIWLHHIFPYLIGTWMSVSKSYFAFAITTAFNSPRVSRSNIARVFNATIAVDDSESLEKALKGCNFEHLTKSEFNLGVLIAAGRNSHRCLPLLLSHKKLDVDQHKSVREATRAGSMEVLRLFLAHPGIEFQSPFVLLAAAQYGQLEALKMLLDDPQVQYESESVLGAMLNEAVRETQMHVVEYLLQLDSPSLTYLDHAVYTTIDAKREDIVERLLRDPRVSVTSDIFRHAIEVDASDVVELCLNYGMTPKFVDLMEAVNSEAPNTLRVLLEDGRADPTEMSHWLLRTAIECNKEGLVRILLEDPRLEESDLPEDVKTLLNTL